MYFYEDDEEDDEKISTGNDAEGNEIEDTEGDEDGEGKGGGELSPESQNVIDQMNNPNNENGNGENHESHENKEGKTTNNFGENVDNNPGEAINPNSKTNLPKTDTNNADTKSGGKGNLIRAGIDGLQEDGLKGAGKGVAKEAAKEAAKKEIKKQMAKRGLDVALKSLSSALAPILFWVAVVILLIIIVVGILMFFIAMPGQIVSKIKGLASNVIKAWTAMIEGEDQMVSTAQLADVANYIESMGYDLKGEGFVTYNKTAADIDDTVNSLTNIFDKGYDNSSDLKDMSSDELKALLYVDETQGVIRRNDTSDVVDLNSESILSYIISDNQCYIIRNFNTSLDNMTEGNGGLVAGIITGIAAVFGAIVMFFTPVGWIGALIAGVVAAAGVMGGSYLAVKMNNNPEYGKGLITLWHEGSRIGIIDGFYESSEKGYIALDAGSKQLKIKRGWANGTYTFNVDGWSGRYGMPLEFLLSVHLATQMPELAVEMATSFETEVEVILHPVNGEMVAGVLKQNSDGTWQSPSSDENFITWGRIKELGDAEASLGQVLWEGLKDAVNGIAGGLTGESPWTPEKLDELGINDKVLCVLFEEGLPHSNSCACCTHIPGSQSSPEEESCESDTDLYGNDGKCANNHSVCDACEKRALDIIAALAIVNDKDWESYTPYISKVKDHWFRDVYFVMNPYVTDEQPDEFHSVIKVDEDYFYETNERWTLYEVWEEGENIPEGFEAGDYKLYEPGSNTPSTKTKAEVQEINEKIALGDTTVTRLIKKAVTEDLAPNTDEGDWSAYEISEGGFLPWMQISIDKGSDVTNELKSDSVYKDEDAETADDIIIHYKESRPDDIKQVEDGQRTETNEKIKDMFLNKKYYKYDGSVARADAIIEDKSREDNKVENYNTGNDNRKEELIAKVDINKDSLGAFSILENTHTLDADYIYRDFKELIVELNYFDKEDLSDKLENVMQWPIPDCGSGGWPIRRYEKGEDFYGTLINSMVDLELMKNADIEAAEKLLAELEDEVDETNPEPVTPTGKLPNCSVQDLVSTGYEVHRIMEGNGWDYCVEHRKDTCTDSGCKRAHCDHYYGNSCGLNSTIQEAQSGYHNTCCATFVSWVLKEAGFDLSNHPSMHSAQGTYNWCEAEGWTPITDYSQMQSGDLLFNNGSSTADIGHVQMLGNSGEWLNGGSVSAINNPPESYETDFIIGMRAKLNNSAEPFEGYKPNQAVVAPLTGKVTEYGEVDRVNEETGELETVEFIKIEAIRNYTTSLKGEGYTECIEIPNTDEEYYTFEDKAIEETKELEGYDYFYEEYQGVLDGFVLYIEGFDLTLYDSDGAKALVEGGTTDTEDVTRYEPNVVYNMTDNLREARALWKEDAKTAALPLKTIDGELYIKEGTVIGKTYEDPDMSGIEIYPKTDVNGEVIDGCTGNGNYMRLILRDWEDSIVEDVETYMNIDDVKNMDVDWEFYYWMPYESGPMDATGKGPEACDTVSDSNEIAVGIAQWTTTTKGSGCNNIAPLCEWLYSKDSNVCAELSVFAAYSTEQIISSFEDLRDAWKAVSTKDRDRFLELQMEYFYEEEFKTWVESSGVEWLLEKEMVTQGTYASLKNWGPNLGWEDVINSSMTDEEICKALLTKACPIDSTCGTLEERWESQYVLARDILDGTFTEAEEWVRTKQPSSIYGEGKNAGVLIGNVILDTFNNIQVDPKFLAMIRKNILNVL